MTEDAAGGAEGQGMVETAKAEAKAAGAPGRLGQPEPPPRRRGGRIEALVGLGSNIDPAANVQAALAAMRDAGFLERASRLWGTPPVGTSGPPFVNAAAILRTSLGRGRLQAWLRRLEGRLGRVRTADRYADRTIDLDLLAVHHGPGPRWHVTELRLADEPFHWPAVAELLPDLRLPGTGETVAEAAARRPLEGAAPLGPEPGAR